MGAAVRARAWVHRTAQDLELMGSAATRVEGVGSPDEWEAEWLAAAASGMGRTQWLTTPPAWTPDVETRAESLKRRRLNHEPLAYVLGEWDFLGLTVEVNASVLVPRPETEELVHLLLNRATPTLPREGRLLDMGTGSGCAALACALAFPQARVDAVDVSPDALAVASRNFHRHGVEHRVDLHQGHLWQAIPADRRYHLVVANLPYIPTRVIPTLEPEVLAEPLVALDGGDDGLALVRRCLQGLPDHVAPGALVGLEVGWDQTETVFSWMKDAGAAAEVRHDAQGHPRMIIGTFP